MTTKAIFTYLLGALAGAAVALTPEMLTAIGAIIVAFVTSVGAVIVNVIMARRVEGVKELVKENIAETQVVKGHVNSAATKAAEEIKSLREELKLMREVASEKKETAALLAQAAAVKPANSPPVAEHSLANIDENTAATVEALKDVKETVAAAKPKK